MSYKSVEEFHKAVRDAQSALDVALRGSLPDLDSEQGHYEIAHLRSMVDKLDFALFRGLYATKIIQSRTQVTLTLEDLGL